jgi:ADP-heptose:LPS heptosyltransferase
MKMMVEQSGKWQLKTLIERDGWALHIYKKLYGKKGIEIAEPLTDKPRACICRYGALGDMIIITPLIHQLYDDGYDVTMNISPYAMPIIEHNPYIKNLIIQEREMIPNPELGPYWDEWRKDYAKYINLSESLEGRFLKVEGRRDFYTPKAWRIKTGEFNYYDATMRLGGYPEVTGVRGELFFTTAEERNCQKALAPYKGKFIVVWAMNGSSYHKIYPAQELVVEDFLTAHPDAYVITVGDGVNRLTYQHQRLDDKTGVWSIRESLCAAKYASLVIGPETMMTNASGSLGTPTITLLSHSTHEALCKHWGANDYCLAPEDIPCYPCFQLHYSKESCPIQRMEDTQTNTVIAEAPACALSGIKPERLLARMEEVYRKFATKNATMVTANGSIG